MAEGALVVDGEAISERRRRELVLQPPSGDKLVGVVVDQETRWENRGMPVVCTAEGWRFQLAAEAFEPLGSLHEQRTPRYSRAVMETLAIIAYQQPVTRGDIEAIRGVAVSQNIMQTLQERGWIEVIGQRDSIGKPSLWATTAAFLSDLQLGSLADLPPLTDLGALVLPDMPQPPAAQEDAHDSGDTDQ